MKYIQVYLQGDGNVRRGSRVDSHPAPKENQECWWNPTSPFVIIIDKKDDKIVTRAIRPESTGSGFEVAFFPDFYCEKELNEIIPFQDNAPKKTNKKTNKEVVLQ